MPAFFARNIRNIALMLLVALATVTVALISSGPTAQANTHTYSGPGGTVANTNEIEIDYVWASANDRVTIGLVKPTGLEAVWTNTATSESFTVAITDSATTTITNQTPVNTWASGTKVKLVVKARSGVNVPTLNGINNELLTTNSRMFEVISLGNFQNFTNLAGAFANTGPQLRISAQLPSGVTILSFAFKGSGFNSDLSGWDTSNVRFFVQTFTNTTNFNQPLSSWNVSSAEDMSNMFANASVFNQDLSSWDVSRVTSMTYMFAQTPQFNNGGQTASASIPGQNPLSWNTPSLSDMSLMFFSAEKFNQNMDNWNTANVTTMYGAFWSAAWFNNGDPKGAFQGDASNSNTVMSWSHGAASTMLSMFRNADAFNQSLDSWNVSRVSSFDTMFFDTADFNNGDRKGAFEGDTYSSVVTMNWRHGASATMKETFKDAPAFNQNLNSWDVSRVGSFESTFYNADAFNNGDRIGAYEGDTFSSDVTMSWSPTANNVTMLSMFNNNNAFNQNLNSWDVSKVSSLASTFYLATAFNNGDSKLAFEGDTYSSNVTMSWSPRSATTFNAMFWSATSFNQDLNSWDVSSGQNFTSTFHLASIFNNGDARGAYAGDARGSSVTMSWSPSSATTFLNMFIGATAFNQNLSTWQTQNVKSMKETFNGATDFNNGYASGVGGTMSWSISQTPDTDMMLRTFQNARAFNQNLNSWNMSKIKELQYTFAGAFAFNNGDPKGAHEGDSSSSDVRMLWNLPSLSHLVYTFQDARSFNQNLNSWSMSNALYLQYAFATTKGYEYSFNNGASSTSSNVMSWSTSKVLSLTGLFQNSRAFNANISGWSTSNTTAMNYVFDGATSFNQPIGSWDIRKVTSFAYMLSGASAFTQDLSNWGPFLANATFDNFLASGAISMGDSPKNWNVSSIGNFDNFFANSTITASASINEQKIRSIIGSWSLQRVQTSKTTGYFKEPVYTNCREWSAYQRLRSAFSWTFNGAVTAFPTVPTCNTVTVTWSPTTAPSFASTNYTPDAPAVTDGPAGVKYAVHHPGSTSCRVHADTGVISYSTSGSCQIIAYDAATNSNTATVAGYEIVTFTLPTPSPSTTPGAPTISAAVGGVSQIGLSFTAPASDGGSAISSYEVGYSLTQGGSPTWVSASGVVTSSPTMSYTLSGLVSGSSYWLKVRAVNSSGVGPASNEFGPVTPATTPSAPSIASSIFGNTQVTLNLTAPLTNGGSPLTTYEYRYATSSAGVASAAWTSSGNTSTTITLSGLVNGTSYFFQVRAVNAIGAGSETAVSSAVTPATTSSPPIIFTSTKLGSLTTAELQFFAPADNGGSAILDYEIRMSTDDGDNWSNWSSQTVTYYPSIQRWGAEVTGLQGSGANPVFYTFELRARNAAGYSSPSQFKPSDLTITAAQFGNQLAVLSFNAAKYDGNLPILGYEYRYVTGTVLNPVTNSGWISISQSVWSTATPTTTASFTISGLTNGVSHVFAVRAVNALGGDANPSWLSPGTPNKLTPTITFSYSVSTVAFAQSASFSPSFSSNSLGDITFSTTTPTKCSVATVSGVVSNLNAGLCTIRLSLAESPTYSAAIVLRSISTTMISQPTLVISASSTTSPYRGTVTLTSSGGGGTGAVSFTAVVGSACVVSGNVVTVGNAGSSCAVIATKASDGNYHAASSTQLSISTTKIAQSTLSFSNIAEMQALSTLAILANGGSGDGVVRYRVSNAGTTGCTLTGTTLSAPSAGQCTIEASRAASTNFNQSASVSQVVEVVKASQTVRFTTNVPTEPLVGGTYSPAATASSGLSIGFSVSGAGCSISGSTITFTSAGDCVVDASQPGSSAYLAAPTASQTIAVGRRNHTLAFNSATQALSTKTYGDAAFVVQATSTDTGASVSFALSAQTTNNACAVFASGLVIVQNVGDCVIEAYSPQTSALAAASTISKRIEVLPDSASAPFITSVAMGNLSITAGFTPPSYIGGSSVSAYTIVAIDQAPNSTVEVSDSSCGTTLVNGQVTCRIAGLENGKTYKIKVAAINGAGIGEYSLLSPAITVATNPAAVQNLGVVQGSTTLAISWDDPDSLGGGTFLAYRVYVKRSSTTSYNTEHYFNVTNQATQNITISAETPPNGFGYPGGPALVNGVAYDIKVVTVTSANLEELTGNTAVVNQIPRTTPEPPRLANALVIGNKLVLTWTAPLSDGGAAITSYSATVGSSPCTFANSTDTYCEIALPTAPGNYVFAIAAQNVAGSSTEIQGVFTVASYNSSTPQTSGGSVVTDPVKPSESAPIVSSVSFSVDGKQIFIRGSFLKGISKVFIGDVEVRIVSQTSEMVILTAPVLAAGSYTVYIHLTDKTVLRYEKDLVVKGTKPATVVKKTAKLTGFKPGSSVLSKAMKNALIKVFKANKGSKTLQCIGHTQGPSILKSDARLAMKRAVAVCEFAKKLGFKVVSSSYQNNKKVGSQFRRVDLVFTK